MASQYTNSIQRKTHYGERLITDNNISTCFDMTYVEGILCCRGTDLICMSPLRPVRLAEICGRTMGPPLEEVECLKRRCCTHGEGLKEEKGGVKKVEGRDQGEGWGQEGRGRVKEEKEGRGEESRRRMGSRR